MKKVLIKFKRIELEKVDLRNKTINLVFAYDENGAEQKIKKSLHINEDVDKFAASLVNEVLQNARQKYASESEDFLDAFVNALLDEKPDSAPTSERIANAIKRFKDKVRGLGNTSRHESYIQQYHSIIGLKADL